MENLFEGKVIVTKDNAKVGMKVQRGRDWIYGTQDLLNGKPSVGEIIGESYFTGSFFNYGYQKTFWVTVEWQYGQNNIYRVGDSEFDLVFADESYKPIINHL